MFQYIINLPDGDLGALETDCLSFTAGDAFILMFSSGSESESSAIKSSN